MAARRLDAGRRRRHLGRDVAAEEPAIRTAAAIERKLRAAFAPHRLEIADESARHAGHAGARPGGETHFRILLVSARFEGLGRVARQRLVYEALADEIAGGVHALAMTTRTPAEDGAAPAERR